MVFFSALIPEEKKREKNILRKSRRIYAVVFLPPPSFVKPDFGEE